MTQFTDKLGNVSATKDDTYKYGSYMYALPELPVGTQKGQTAVTGTTYAAGYGWRYDQDNGTIMPNCTDSELDANGVAYNTY